ncbi:MAG: AI-2E family transporter [Coriobacteriia bacterium]|nr:AI-2E family transporter [Coriobacteriia bacterium]
MDSQQLVVRMPRATQILLTMAAVVIVLGGMRGAASFVSTFLLALVLTVCLAPLPGKLTARGLPMWLAFLLTVLGTLLFIVALAVILGGALLQFAHALPKYAENLVELRESVQSTAQSLGFDTAQFDIAGFVDPVKIGGILVTMLDAILSTLSSTALLLILLFFMMLDAIGFAQKADRALASRPRAYEGWKRFVHDTRRYVFITGWTGMLVGVVDALILLFLGVDFALLWGILAFLFSFVPNIGFVLSLIPPAILALLEFGWTKCLIVIAAYILINAGVDNVLKPKVIGDDLNLSLATTFISLVVWGFVIGPMGAILAIPLTLLVLHVILESGDDSRWLADMLMQKPTARAGGAAK